VEKLQEAEANRKTRRIRASGLSATKGFTGDEFAFVYRSNAGLAKRQAVLPATATADNNDSDNADGDGDNADGDGDGGSTVATTAVVGTVVPNEQSDPEPVETSAPAPFNEGI
jgi:hypothetical protein